MKSIEYVQMSLDAGRVWLMDLIEDVQDEPMTQPTSAGGNHPLWILGHIVCSEAGIFDGFILGRQSRFKELNERFGVGSQPTTNPDDYPPLEELKQQFNEIRGAVVQHLQTLTDEDLSKPSNAPEKFGSKFATVGSCYAALAMHPVFHAGQVADARRVLGRAPVSR